VETFSIEKIFERQHIWLLSSFIVITRKMYLYSVMGIDSVEPPGFSYMIGSDVRVYEKN